MNLQSLIPSSVAHSSLVPRALRPRNHSLLRSWLVPAAAIAVIAVVALSAKDIARYIRISTM